MKNKDLTPEEEARLKDIAAKLEAKTEALTKLISTMPERLDAFIGEAEREMKKEINNYEQNTQ
jgi:hypothetical protein